MNILDDDFRELVSLVNVSIDGPEQGVINRRAVEAAELKLVELLSKYGGVLHGQKVEHLRRIAEADAMARELDAVAPTPADKFRLMFNRPTPRTDALKAEYLKSTPVPWTALMTCGTLERKLAEAREEGEEQARLLGMSGEREAGLLAEIDRLKRWKSEQMAVESSWDPQAIGQELGLPLGSDIRPQILPAIVDLKRELAEARETISTAINSANARQAETEHARRRLSEARGLLKYANKGAERNAEALRISLEKLNEARGQRDEAKEALQSADRHNQHMLVELEVAREQRDRLAEALRGIKDRALDETVRLHPDADAKGCVDDCLEWAESALAALKGGTNDA
jgi:hypothetical protein